MSAVVEYPREAIALALAESSRLCAGNPFGDCSWYHASWPVLKGLGVFISLKSDDDFLLPQLRAAIAGGSRRILISGTADAGMLARIAACRDAAPDGLDMVYLESLRHHRRAALRQVVSGQRIPIALPSLGHAHLADVVIELPVFVHVGTV